jgi:hypothetical protein
MENILFTLIQTQYNAKTKTWLDVNETVIRAEKQAVKTNSLKSRVQNNSKVMYNGDVYRRLKWVK